MGSHSTCNKKFPFSGSELDATPRSPLTQPAMASAPDYKGSRHFAIAQAKIRLRSKLMCGSLDMVNECDLGVEVVHGCLAIESSLVSS